MNSYAATGQGFVGNNMFAYCINNPVNMSDDSGHAPQWINDLHEGLVELVTSFLTDKTEDLIYSAVGAGQGANIANSYTVDNPVVMYKYVKENRGG